jgi:hypothetical protein
LFGSQAPEQQKFSTTQFSGVLGGKQHPFGAGMQHRPSRHPAPHVTPQVPQFLGSVRVSVQKGGPVAPAQIVVPGSSHPIVHVPYEHTEYAFGPTGGHG